MPHSNDLVVWMNGERVGVWSQPRGGAASFQYDPEWISSDSARRLSLSLPFTPANTPHKGDAVTHYFENLLPDSADIRNRLRQRYSTASTEAFDLLAAIGRDCVGAVQLLPDGETPKDVRRVDAELLDESGVERALAATLSNGRILGQEEEKEIRISIAGAQEKTALLRHNNQWWLPRGSTPTTHILKLPLGLVGNLQADMKDSVENEWLCSRILDAYGLAVASCEIGVFGSRKALVVERFDRMWVDGEWIARRPQEDFCQALGVAPAHKYESEGGPGMGDILRVLTTSIHRKEDSRAFVKAQMIFWILAATDGHAKNFSLFHERGGTYRMTPLYDVLSAWPIIGPGPRQLSWHKAALAMAVRGKNAHWKLKEILPRHWDSVASAAELMDAKTLIAELVEQTPKVIASVNAQLPQNFPAPISDRIFQGMKEQVARLSA